MGRKIKRQYIRKQPLPDFVVVSKSAEPNNGQIEERLEVFDLKCLCENYEGQNWDCKVHVPKYECPYCRGIDSEKEIEKQLPDKRFRCLDCGYFYVRNMDTGKYLRTSNV